MFDSDDILEAIKRIGQNIEEEFILTKFSMLIVGSFFRNPQSHQHHHRYSSVGIGAGAA
jgi:hypothetical protein